MKQFILSSRIPEILHRHGIDTAAVLRRADLPDDLFTRSLVRVDADEYYRFAEAAFLGAGSDEAMVRLAVGSGLERLTPPAIGAMCSRNAVEAVERMSRYAEMFLPMRISVDTCPEGDVGISLRAYRDDYELPPTVAAMQLLFMLNMFRRCTGVEITPRRMRVCVPPSPAIDAYAGIPAEYGSGECVMTLSADDAARPFTSSNDELWDVIEPELNRRLAELRAGITFADRVEATLCGLLPSGHYKVEDVADRLHLSARTLQRRLQQEGLKFQTVLRRARRSLDSGLDRIPGLAAADRAYLLGFSHSDCYRRAMGHPARPLC